MVCTWWWKGFFLFGAVEIVATCNIIWVRSCSYHDDKKTIDCTDVALGTLTKIPSPSDPLKISKFLLGNSQLKRLGGNVFSSVPNLLHLNISNNFLEVLDSQTFSNLTQLQCLDLTNNKLLYLHDELLFKSQENLLSLLLANNKLKTLDSAVLHPLKSIKELSLAGNPFVCNCQLGLTMEWCKEKSLNTQSTCALPRKYSGSPWSVLNTSELCKVGDMENEINVNESASTTERSAENTTLAEWNGGTSTPVIIVCVCLTILLSCAGIVTSLCYWRNCREKGTCKIVKYKGNSTDSPNTSYYYTDVSPRSQNMVRISLPPVLPKRPSKNETGIEGQLQNINGAEPYNYSESNLIQLNNLKKNSGQCSGYSESTFKRNKLHTPEESDCDSLHTNSFYEPT